MKLRMLMEAENEANETAQWYESQRHGLGFAFLDELSRGLEVIEQNPTRHNRVTEVPKSREVRRFLLKRFPFKVIYETRSDEILIVAVAHVRRRPGYWKNRRDPQL